MPDRFVIPAITLAALLLSMPHARSAERSDKHGTLRGDATKGRDLFNGQGICHYCHGVDGFLERLPTLAPDTKAVIDRLSPPPADLRKPDQLHLKDDQARFRAIREGHSGSAMFPNRTLNDEDIKDVLAYLSTLRRNAPAPGQSPY